MLNRDLFNNEEYLKNNSDVKESNTNPYDHYHNNGIFEGREAVFDFEKLDLNKLKIFYYHAIADDPKIKNFGEMVYFPLPFYMRSDMVLHLPILEYYASKCKKITEFGVKNGYSTIAFLCGLPNNGHLVSYDIEETCFTKWLKHEKWTFHKKDTGAIKIEPTDLLYFDTLHTYEQLNKEIKLHESKASKYLIFHDFENEEVKKAVGELLENKKYKIIYSTEACNGLLILDKTI